MILLLAASPFAPDTSSTRIVLIHGAATTAHVWDGLARALAGAGEIVTPQRAYSGDLERELHDLRDIVTGAFVVGVSGGATLGLALAVEGVPILGAVLHEPAAGSLAPGLLDHVIRARNEGGDAAFGAALYGSGWADRLLPNDPEAVGRDLAMFRAFEPTSPQIPLTHVTLTVGGSSPGIRHDSVKALARLTGAQTCVVPRAGHAVHLTEVPSFAQVIVERLHASVTGRVSVGSWQASNRKKGN